LSVGPSGQTEGALRWFSENGFLAARFSSARQLQIEHPEPRDPELLAISPWLDGAHIRPINLLYLFEWQRQIA